MTVLDRRVRRHALPGRSSIYALKQSISGWGGHPCGLAIQSDDY